MLNYIEYLEIPTQCTLVLAGAFFVIQIIGELLEFKGKVVPEFFKVRKYFNRKKAERNAIRQLPRSFDEIKFITSALKDAQKTLDDMIAYCGEGSIQKREIWAKNVDSKLCQYEDKQKEYEYLVEELIKKIDRNSNDILSLLVDNKRNFIIEFASCVIDAKYSVTKEQFNRAFKMYEDYEEIIQKNNLTNGEVDIAHRIIVEAYENHLRNHTFVEDIKGYV